MVAAPRVGGKPEVAVSEVDARAEGDLLLALALGEARAETLTDLERAAIAVETPVTRALRWATSVDGVRHLALVGPAGAGKSFAVRMADRLGLAGFELPDPDAAIAAEVARDVVTALRENRRLLLTARPDVLSAWAARDDIDGALTALLEEVCGAIGARDEWPPSEPRSIDVLDLSYAVVARADVLNELLRRAASLALGGPPDTAREAASVALRDRNVCTWARACALDAEQRRGPLTIAELWHFVATLACGARPARGRGRFDLADSVAARLLRHEFMSPRLRDAANHQGAFRADWLAALAGFDGAAEEVHCSEPQILGGVASIHLVEPPGVEALPGDYRDTTTRLSGGVRLSARAALPPSLAGALAVLATTGGRRVQRREGVAERVASYEASVEVSAGTPNLFMRRALEGAWATALWVRGGGRTMVLAARDYAAVCDLAARGGSAAVATHPIVADWHGMTQERLGESARAGPEATPEGRAQGLAENHDVFAPRATMATGDSTLTNRPLGILFAFSEQGSLDASIREGGAFRVASPADLASTISTLSARVDHVDRWRPEDHVVLGDSLRGFIDARAGLVDACAQPRRPSDDARALGASLLLELISETGTRPIAAIERYLSAYAAIMEAAIAEGGDVLDRALMLDVAYCPTATQRRARLLPLHPLMVSCWGLSGAGRAEVLPPVIAIRHLRMLALYAEGEHGFYHGDPERWPPTEAQRFALREVVHAWLRRAGDVTTVDVDLIDARFTALLVGEVATCVAQHARERGLAPVAVRARALASSPTRAAFVSATRDDAHRGVEGASVACDPSVRSASEVRRGALVFAVIPAPHGGRERRPGSERHPCAVEVYLRALEEARIDTRPHRLEPSSEPSFQYSGSLSWWTPPLRGEEGVRGEWRVNLHDGLAFATPQARPPSVDTASAAADPIPTSPASPASPVSVAEALPLTEPPSRPSDDGRGSPSGDEEVVPPARRRWSREDLRAQVARAFGRSPYASDASLVADLVRDVVSTRRGPLRHVVVRDVAECLGQILEVGEAQEVVTRTVDALVDLGDLVARRSGERGPYLLELASAALVDLRGSGSALVLGRAEAALSDSVRGLVVSAGMLRALDLAKAGDAREELRFRGVAELTWEEWARTPRHRSPDEALRAQGGMKRFEGVFGEYDVFDPTSAPRFYRGRFSRGELERVLARDRWAVGACEKGFEGREYRLFRREDGAVTSSVLDDYSRFVELAAACAALAARGRPFLASEGGGVVRLHFPPPRWLARALALGQAVDPGDALVAWRVPEELQKDVLSALRGGLWCEVVSG